MKKTKFLVAALTMASFGILQAQEQEQPTTPEGHLNNNRFKQLYEEFATPNQYRTAAGAPGHAYYQQQADYKMDIELDDESQKLYGTEVITYTNNSPDVLEYLWVQLDQNIRKKDAPALLKNPQQLRTTVQASRFAGFLKEPFDGGFNIEHVKDAQGNPISHTINNTMMRVDMKQPLQPGETFSFEIKWWYNVNNHVVNRARSGFEHFEENGNNAYVIAQFFPRMAVYNDVEGWQNYQFWGNGEFALPFGNYEVNITVPADHIMEATGTLQNAKDVLNKEQYKRFEASKTSFDKPVFIVTEEEAIENEKGFSKKKNTWTFKAENVRDFAFSTSRKFIWERQAVKMNNGSTVMAVSLYPKEGNPLWEEYSTKAVIQTLKTYSKHTFDYPYPKAVSVHAKNQGMEYPMICWNYGRPNAEGKYSDRTKFGMISVIIHEVGHNFFPMIVNSDERQWGWMDEGLDTFMQYLAEQEFGQSHPEAIKGYENYPSRRGEPKKIVPYMKGNQDFISPIMSNPENVYQLGPNAYSKPATALNILRETVMGKELFDHAFKTYAQRWMFKHPTPEDFFRTMEDASAVDLDWFWRGWFYSTEVVDMGVKNITKAVVTSTAPKKIKDLYSQKGYSDADLAGMVYLIDANSEEYTKEVAKQSESERFKALNEYMMDNFDAAERNSMEIPKFFYEITFNKPGGIPMPLIVEYTFEDGSKELVNYPAQIWRKNDKEVKIVLPSNKEIQSVVVDPKQETADINLENNQWPQKKADSEFDKFKERVMKK